MDGSKMDADTLAAVSKPSPAIMDNDFQLNFIAPDSSISGFVESVGMFHNQPAVIEFSINCGNYAFYYCFV